MPQGCHCVAGHCACLVRVGARARCTNSDYYKVSQLTQASCQIQMRNQIYKGNGYCLHTPKAIDAFGNAGCVHDDMADVPLNDAGQHNVSAIKGAEAANGC